MNPGECGNKKAVQNGQPVFTNRFRKIQISLLPMAAHDQTRRNMPIMDIATIVRRIERYRIIIGPFPKR
jgi:hypothetical protein